MTNIINSEIMMDIGKSDALTIYSKYKNLVAELTRPGVYAIMLCGEVVYVGQSGNLFGRLINHCDNIFHADIKLNDKYAMLKPFSKYLSWCVLEYVNDATRSDVENKYISKYKPIFNIITDDGYKYFWGTKKDIEDFCYGLITIEELQEMIHYVKENSIYAKCDNLMKELDDTVQLPEDLISQIKNYTLNINGVNAILKVMSLKNEASKKYNCKCKVAMKVLRHRLAAKIYDQNGNCIATHIDRKRRIW
jgi:hypothetical protein